MSLALNNWAQMAKWLMLPTLDHKVLGLNSTDTEFDLSMYRALLHRAFHCHLPIISINNVERDVKHQSSSSDQIQITV